MDNYIYSISINIIVHIIFILSFLTAFYNLIVLNIEKNAYMSNINNVIDSSIKGSTQISLLLQNKNITVPPDTQAQENNNYLNILITTIIIFLTIFAITLSVLPNALKFNFKVDLKSIMLKIFIVAVVTGAIEYYTFINIISKYIPITGSEVKTSFTNEILANLN